MDYFECSYPQVAVLPVALLKMRQQVNKKRDAFFPTSLLINGQTITDKFTTAEKFNNLFLYQLEKNYNIRSMQLKEITLIIVDILKICPTRRDYSYYLRHPNPNSFFTSPTSPDEVKDNIQYLKINKSTSSNSLLNKCYILSSF